MDSDFWNNFNKWSKLSQQLDPFSSIVSQLNKVNIYDSNYRKKLDFLTGNNQLTSIMSQLSSSTNNSSLDYSYRKSINFLINQNNISESVISSFSKIHLQNNLINNNLSEIIDRNINRYNLNNYSNLRVYENSSFGLADVLAKIAQKHQNFQLIEDFEDLNQSTLEIIETFLNQETNNIDDELIEKLNQYITSIKEMLLRYKIENVAGILWVILSAIVTINDLKEIIFPDNAPKKIDLTDNPQILQLQNSIIDIKTIVDNFNNSRIIIRNVKIYDSPKAKKKSIDSLLANTNVREIDSISKWILISYYNNKEDFPKTGWIMKKYSKRIK